MTAKGVDMTQKGRVGRKLASGLNFISRFLPGRFPSVRFLGGVTDRIPSAAVFLPRLIIGLALGGAMLAALAGPEILVRYVAITMLVGLAGVAVCCFAFGCMVQSEMEDGARDDAFAKPGDRAASKCVRGSYSSAGVAGAILPWPKDQRDENGWIKSSSGRGEGVA